MEVERRSIKMRRDDISESDNETSVRESIIVDEKFKIQNQTLTGTIMNTDFAALSPTQVHTEIEVQDPYKNATPAEVERLDKLLA